MTETTQPGESTRTAGRTPSIGTFLTLLITLWALNIADTFQTLYLRESGLLAMEANYFIDFFLKEGRAPFFSAKILALILVTSILFRGWLDRRGIKLAGTHYPPEQVRRVVILLLTAGIVYYILIVGFPFVAMALSGQFSPGDQAPL